MHVPCIISMGIAFQSGQNKYYGNTLLACVYNTAIFSSCLATTSASSQAMKGVLKLLVFGFVLFMAPVESASIPGSMYL